MNTKKDPYVVRMAARHQPHASASAPTHQLPSRSERLDGQSPVRETHLRASGILQGSNQGTAVYTETHELTTTKTGTINLLIGGGNAQAGAFAEIDWSKAPYFLRLGMKQKVETKYTRYRIRKWYRCRMRCMRRRRGV